MTHRRHTTRRDFILTGSASLGSAFLALSASPAFAALVRQTPPILTTAGAATFEAVVRALSLAPGTRVRADGAPAARAALGTAFMSTDDGSQRTIAGVLGQLDAKATRAPFSAQSDRANFQLLRKMHAARTSAELEFERGAAALAAGHESFAPGPAGVQDFLLRQSDHIAQEQARLTRAVGTDAASLDPETGLATGRSPRPEAPPAPALDVTSDAFLQRSVAAAAMSLVGAFFYPPRSDGPPL
jgi:hypothetical protein